MCFRTATVSAFLKLLGEILMFSVRIADQDTSRV
jgi:hypothetical protein